MKMNKAYTIAVLDKITEWSLYILILCMPFSKSIIEICIASAFISWCFKKILLRDFRLKGSGLGLYILAFAIASSVSIVNTELKLFVLKSLFTKCFKYMALYFIMVETVDSDRKFRNIIKAGLISAVVVIIDGYIQHYFTHYDLMRFYPSFKYAPLTDSRPGFLGFPTGPFPFPNDLSSWILVAVMPAISLFIWGRSSFKFKFLQGGLTAALLFLFYLANTRSAWLGFALSFFIMVLVKNRKVLIKIMLAAVLMIGLIYPFLSREKIKDVINPVSLEDRAYMWRIGWNIFKEHPVIGNGFNTFFGKFMEFREDEYRGLKGSYVHNAYLQTASDSGIIGLAAFLSLLGAAFLRILRFIRNCSDSFYGNMALGLAGGLLAFLIHAFFDTNMQSLPLVALFWFVFAFMMSLGNIKRDERKI